MKLNKYEVRNRCRHWTDSHDNATEYRGIICKDGMCLGQYGIIDCKHLQISEDGTRIYNFFESYELGTKTIAYQAWLDNKNNPEVTTLTNWSISLTDGEYYLEGREYERFHVIVIAGIIDHAEGAFLVTRNGKKYLLDPYLSYWSTPISLHDLPAKLKPKF